MPILTELGITDLYHLPRVWGDYITGLAEQYDRYGTLRGWYSPRFDVITFVFDDGVVTVNSKRHILAASELTTFD